MNPKIRKLLFKPKKAKSEAPKPKPKPKYRIQVTPQFNGSHELIGWHWALEEIGKYGYYENKGSGSCQSKEQGELEADLHLKRLEARREIENEGVSYSR